MERTRPFASLQRSDPGLLAVYQAKSFAAIVCPADENATQIVSAGDFRPSVLALKSISQNGARAGIR
jgi:hypothetical protein